MCRVIVLFRKIFPRSASCSKQFCSSMLHLPSTDLIPILTIWIFWNWFHCSPLFIMLPIVSRWCKETIDSFNSLKKWTEINGNIGLFSSPWGSCKSFALPFLLYLHGIQQVALSTIHLPGYKPPNSKLISMFLLKALRSLSDSYFMLFRRRRDGDVSFCRWSCLLLNTIIWSGTILSGSHSPAS